MGLCVFSHHTNPRLDRRQFIIRHEPHSPYVFLYTYVVGSTFMYSFSAYTFKQGAKRRIQRSNNSNNSVNNNVLPTGQLDIRINKCGYVQFMNVIPRRQEGFRWSGYLACSLYSNKTSKSICCITHYNTFLYYVSPTL